MKFEIATEPLAQTTIALAAFYAITQISINSPFEVAVPANCLIVLVLYLLIINKRR